MSALKEQINVIKNWARENTGQIKDVEPTPDVKLDNRPTDLGEDAKDIGRKILSAAMADRCAYEPTQDPGFQLHPETLPAVLENKDAKNEEGEALYNFEATQVQYMLETLAPYADELKKLGEVYSLGIGEKRLTTTIYPQVAQSQFDAKRKATLGLDGQLLYRKLMGELDTARNTPDSYNTNTPMVQKIQRGVQVYSEGRVSDALTILENARKEDPHNKLTSYVLSNIFYHRAAQGHRKFLPQAREEAKRAATRIDKIDKAITDRFGYNYIAIDGYFGPERQLEVIRNFGQLVPPAEQASEEAHAQYIKTMVYLSLTPATDWTEKDIAIIEDMALEYVGGGLLFAVFFEKKVLPQLYTDNNDTTEMFKPLANIILLLKGLQHNLNEVRRAIREHFAENVEQLPPDYWTINRRLMRVIATTLPAPVLDMYLANTSLSGNAFTETENLDRALAEQELEIGPFWNLWIEKINFASKSYSPKVLPHTMAIKEGEILQKVALALEDLKRAESRILNQDKWDLSHLYQPKYNYESLAELGLGHAYTSASFAPKNSVLAAHYKLWGGVLPTGILPSEIIIERAKEGGFANITEVIAALDGAERLLKEPEYGLAANQEKGWQLYLNKQDIADKNNGGIFKELMSEVMWFILIIPAAILAFMLVANSSSMASGSRTFSIIFIGAVIMGCGLVIVYRSSQIQARRSQRRVADDTHMMGDGDDHHDDDEDVSLQDLAQK